MKIIDLRSDTVTQPVAGMRDAMARADVGDDVYGEDPTVNRLQELAAERLGKPVALLVPSGTMANQAALRALTEPGDVVLAGEGAHVLRYEAGAAAGLSGLQIQTVGSGGLLTPEDVHAAAAPPDVHYAPTRVLALENTHNAAGGVAWPPEQLRAVADAARERGLSVHLDGARLFNAAEASGEAPAELAACADTVSFCLSKGLGAPVGSLVCSSAELAPRIHRARKMLGGAMRQAGVLAAAGIYALTHHVARLQEDHANSRRLAQGLAELGLAVDAMPQTNIVVFRVPDRARFARETRRRDLLINLIDAERFRAVTHLDVDSNDIEDALSRIAEALG